MYKLQTAKDRERAKSHWMAFIGVQGSILRRSKYFLTGVIMPIACIAAALTGANATVDQPWQSGHMDEYVAMLFRAPALTVFLPILAFSMICLSIWVTSPRLAKYAVVRLGIHGGAILSCQFLALLMIITGPASPIICIFLGPIFSLVAFGAGLAMRRAKRFTILHLLTLTLLAAVTLTVIKSLEKRYYDLLAMVLLGLLAAGPTLNALTYLRATIEIVNREPKTANKGRTAIVSWAAWITTWIASWKLALDHMFIEYSKLPTTDPNCYISSAAAHGHPNLVGAYSQSGHTINLQMCRLKFLEFSLAVACPVSHTAIRSAYNRWGPVLARICQTNAWFSDATYLALKPFEYIAVLIGYLANVPSGRIKHVYCRTGTENTP